MSAKFHVRQQPKPLDVASFGDTLGAHPEQPYVIRID